MNPCTVVDRSFTFHWSDYDRPIATGTATEDFGYVVDNTRTFTRGEHPPDLVAATRWIARGVLEKDVTDAWTWNTSTVAAGSYWIWSFVVDPPAEAGTISVIDFAPYPLTVAHPGDKIWPSVAIIDPDSPYRFADEDFVISYAACDPDHSGRVKLEYTLNTDGSGLMPIADGLPTGNGGAPETYRWNTTCVPQGNVLIRATITDGRGFKWAAWGRYFLLLTHLTQSDAGCITSTETVDAGIAKVGKSKGCTCLAREPTRGTIHRFAPLVLWAMVWRRRRQWSERDNDDGSTAKSVTRG
jgi:hypothetical protein